MKQIQILLSALFLVSLQRADAQSAIYVCGQTGKWGVAYYDGSPVTMDELQTEALIDCVEDGGINCRYFYSDTCRACWWAFIISIDGNSINYLAKWSKISQTDAEDKVREAYMKKRGVDDLNSILTTWYVRQ